MSISLGLTIYLLVGQMGTDPVHKIIRELPHEVTCLAFSPDGKLLATGARPSEGGKDALTLWNVVTGKEVCRLGEDHHFGCSSLAFSPDGKTLVTNGGPAETLQLWDVNARRVRLSIKVKPGIGGSLTVSPDSKVFATSDYGSSVRLFDLQTGKETRVLEGAFKPLSIAFSADGKLIATCGYDGVVALWDLASGKPISLRKRRTRTVNSVAFSLDSKTLYSLGTDGRLVEWDTASGQARRIKDLKTPRTRYAALSPDGKTLAVLGQDALRLFDLAKEEFWPGIAWDDQPGRKECVSFSPDGKLIATGSGGNPTINSVYIYKIPERKGPEPKR